MSVLACRHELIGNTARLTQDRSKLCRRPYSGIKRETPKALMAQRLEPQFIAADHGFVIRQRSKPVCDRSGNGRAQHEASAHAVTVPAKNCKLSAVQARSPVADVHPHGGHSTSPGGIGCFGPDEECPGNKAAPCDLEATLRHTVQTRA